MGVESAWPANNNSKRPPTSGGSLWDHRLNPFALRNAFVQTGSTVVDECDGRETPSTNDSKPKNRI